MTHHYKPYHWEDREYGDNYYEFGEGEGRLICERWNTLRWRSSGSVVAAAEEDDLKEIILRERLHEKRNMETSLKILLTISSYFHTKYKNTHETVCILSGWVLDLWCCIDLGTSKYGRK
jgi:hypothetical protein